MHNIKLSINYSLVETEDTIFFLPLLSEETIRDEIPYVESETGQTIIRMVQEGVHSVSDIASGLQEEFDVQEDVAIRDTVEFINSLLELGVLEYE